MATLPTLLAELDAMKLNTRLHAIWFLQHGELHPEIHFVIRDRLESSIRRVQQAGPEARAALLAEIPAEGTA